MALKDELWRCDDGAVSLYENRAHSDNDILFTVVGYLLGAVTFSDASAVVSARRIKEGVFSRLTDLAAPSAHDDHLGAAVLDARFAEEMLRHGRATGWMWGKTPELWFGRLPIFPPTIELLATGDCSYIGKLMLSGAFLANAWKGDVNDCSRLLLWTVYKGIKGKSKLVDLALAIWTWRVGPTPKRIFHDYFSYMYPDNPLGKPENAPTSW